MKTVLRTKTMVAGIIQGKRQNRVIQAAVGKAISIPFEKLGGEAESNSQGVGDAVQ